MRNRRLPLYIIPIALFCVAGMLYAHFRGTLTLKGFLISVAAVIAVVIIATQTNRGPYI
ncbi:MAG: hypothetical protein ACR2M3_04020 [Thermomicrobiales bacterium]